MRILRTQNLHSDSQEAKMNMDNHEWWGWEIRFEQELPTSTENIRISGIHNHYKANPSIPYCFQTSSLS